MTVDVEDYFQVEAFSDRVSREDWNNFPSRVDRGTRILLDLFEEHHVQATFFIVGWVADRNPNLVSEIVARGHELGCHSYWHRTVYRPDSCRVSRGYATRTRSHRTGRR